MILKNQKMQTEINEFSNTFSLHMIIFSRTKVVNSTAEKINEMCISYKIYLNICEILAVYKKTKSI